MDIQPKGPQAARLRQHKFALLRRFPIPPDLLPGSLSLTHRRCGQPTCHGAHDPQGNPVWLLTFMVNGKKRVERIPDEWVEEVQGGVAAGREYKEAWPRSSRLMRNCWPWGGSRDAGERADAAPPLEVRGEVSAPEVVLALAGRWPHAGAHSRRRPAVGFADRGGAAPGRLCRD